jgi:hypothetical protein
LSHKKKAWNYQYYFNPRKLAAINYARYQRANNGGRNLDNKLAGLGEDRGATSRFRYNFALGSRRYIRRLFYSIYGDPRDLPINYTLGSL